MFQYSYFEVSDKGLCRQFNEDASGSLDCRANGRGRIFVLADGMGGHNAGDVASQLAVSTVLQYFSVVPGIRPEEWLERAFAWANQTLLEYCAAHPETSGMGTTLTALVLLDGYAVAAGVGDSRIHLLRGEGCTQLTEDDTVVADLVRGGQLRESDALGHARRNVLSKALGNDFYDGISHFGKTDILDGDTFLLCSDGLYTHVESEEFIQAVKEMGLESAGMSLLDKALTRGGHDNITIQLVRAQAAESIGLAEDVNLCLLN